MVQIIDRAPTVGQTLAGIIGQGAEGAAQGFADAEQFSLQKGLESFRDQAKGSRVDEILAGITDERYGDQEKQIIKAIAMGDIPAQAGNQILQQLTARPEQKQITPKEQLDVLNRWETAGKNTIGKNEWDDLRPREKEKYRRMVEQNFQETGDMYSAIETARQALLRDIEGPETEDLNEDISKPGTQSDSAWKLGTQNSIIGRMNAIANGESIKDFNERLALPEDANIFEKTQYKIAQFIADSPFYYAGGQAGATAGAFTGGALGATTVIGIPFGAAAGTLVGGGAGTMALPAMIDSALTQYHEYLSNGGEGSFEGFVEAVGKTLKDGVDAGTEGAIFGIISRVMPLLKKNNSMRKLFESTGKKGKVAETVVTSALESGAILSSRMASGQQVTHEDAGELFTTILGFNTFSRMTPRLQRKVAQTIEKTGIHPQDFIENVKLDMEAKGVDPTNPRELQKSVTDVSKKYSKAKDVFKEAHKPEIGEQQLEAKRTEEKQLAERITKEPVEEILAEKKPTKKVQEATEQMRKAESRLNEAQEKLKTLETATKKSPIIEKAVELTKKEIKEAQSAFESAKTNLEEVTPVKQREPTPEELGVTIKEHNSRLVEAARNPTGAEAKKLENLFDRDQKYIDRLQEQAKKQPLPEPKTYDRYMRPLEAYNKSYESLIEDVNRKRKSLEKANTPEARTEKETLDRLANILDKNMKINRAKMELHKPKRFIREVARGQGKPFLKQSLKDLGVRAKEFEKDFFKVRDALEGIDKKVEDVVGPKAKQAAKIVENLVKEPSTKNVEKLASETGLTQEKIEQTQKQAEKLAKETEKKIKEGNTTASILNDLKKEIDSYKIDTLSKIKRAALGALIGGIIQEGLEKSIGWKPPLGAVSFFLPGFQKVRYGATIVQSLGKHVVSSAQNKYWKDQFEKATGPERAQLRRRLKRKGWSDVKINKLRR